MNKEKWTKLWYDAFDPFESAIASSHSPALFMAGRHSLFGPSSGQMGAVKAIEIRAALRVAEGQDTGADGIGPNGEPGHQIG